MRYLYFKISLIYNILRIFIFIKKTVLSVVAMAQIICTMALTSCTGKKNDDTGTVKESSKKSSSSSKANP